MALYRQKPPTIEAVRVASPEHAAELLGGTLSTAGDPDWTVTITTDWGEQLPWSGQVGDYVTGETPWFSVRPAAEFEALYEPITVE